MASNAVQSSLFETNAGTWKIRWRVHGKNQQRTFRRKLDAQNFQSELFNGKKTPVAMKGIFFEDFCEIWFERHCRINVCPSTGRDYEMKVRANMIPFFKGMALAQIDEDDVIRFKEWLTVTKGFSPVTVGNLLRYLKLLFKCACRWKDDNKRHYLVVSPASHVKEPKRPEPDFRFWTEAHIKKFLNYTVDKAPIVHEVALLTIATGMRRGEIHQLQRDCLDFVNRLITVKRAYSFISRQVQHTKAGRIRRIPMNDEIYHLLQKYRGIDDPNKRIYEGVNIEHFHKFLRKWSLEAGVPVLGLHDLRDTFASSLVRSGMKIKVIQKLLGHVDISVTEKYMHLDPNDLEGSTDCLITGTTLPSYSDAHKTGACTQVGA